MLSCLFLLILTSRLMWTWSHCNKCHPNANYTVCKMCKIIYFFQCQQTSLPLSTLSTSKWLVVFAGYVTSTRLAVSHEVVIRHGYWYVLPSLLVLHVGTVWQWSSLRHSCWILAHNVMCNVKLWIWVANSELGSDAVCKVPGLLVQALKPCP